jgi:hypothetical protein
MTRHTFRFGCLVAIATSLAAVSGLAQTPTPSDPAPASPQTPSFLRNIQVSGLVDGYYSLNFNHPASKTNTIRNFDVRANQFSLNFAKLSLEHAPAPVGFKLELAAGRAMEIFHATEPAGTDVYDYMLQAYVSLKPESWGGLQFDFGKFVTAAGAEVTETHLNWNYSRSLLYANGPYYHFGARATVPVSSNFTAGVQLVNGWNNVEDNNSGKTVGLVGAFTSKYVNWSNVYYVGNEKTDVLDGVGIPSDGLRHFYDTVIAINPNGKVNGLFNFDYGVEKFPGARDSHFYGFSGAMRVPVNDMWAFSPRYDWYKDRDGFITTVPQTLQEFTFTVDAKVHNNFLTRFEFRRDWSDQPFFDRGNQTMNTDNQTTLLIGFVYSFGPE